MSARDRLDAVLRLRKLEEERAAASAAWAEQRARETQQRLQDRREAYRTRPAPREGLRPVELLALRLTGIRDLEAVQEAAFEADSAIGDQRAANEARSFASVRRRSAERLADRRQGEASRIARAAAQRSLDELAVLRGMGR